MLAKLTSSIVHLLSESGINAGRAYPKERMKQPEGCFVRVRLESAAKSEAGFAGYLGISSDENGNTREVWGMHCALELAMDIYASPGSDTAAEDCEALVDDIIFALEQAEGLRIGEVKCSGAQPDRDTGLFRCGCRAKTDVLLIAGSENEAAQFSDFILKGEIKK